MNALAQSQGKPLARRTQESMRAARHLQGATGSRVRYTPSTPALPPQDGTLQRVDGRTATVAFDDGSVARVPAPRVAVLAHRELLEPGRGQLTLPF